MKHNHGADAYCNKVETRIEGPWTFGAAPLKRNDKRDWEKIWESAKAGKMDDIPVDVRVQHYCKLKQIVKDHIIIEGEADDVKGIWIYGDSGVGKSRFARDTYPGFHTKQCNKWWDGYQGNPFVLLEDLDPKNGHHLGYHIKLWADRYHTSGETKGGIVALKHEKFIVTSQYLPEDIWDDVKTREAIRRRFKFHHILPKL